MDIPGRKKKDGPGKTVLELYLYLLLYWHQSVLCEEFTTCFQLSERTLFRYVKELNAVCSGGSICHSGREGRKEFVLRDGPYEPLEEPELSFFPEDPHLTRLSRLICLYHLIDEKVSGFFYPDDDDEQPSVSDLADIINKAGFPEFSLRTLQRDLKEIRIALDLFDEYDETH